MTAPAPDSAGARASVILLGIVWGLNWPAVKVALTGVTPWTLRAVGLGLGALTLLALALLRRRSVAVPAGRPRRQLAIAGLLNVAGFNLLAAFAQLSAATSRVAIVAYTMPLWATFLAWLVLGERLDPLRALALVLGASGLSILLLPLVGAALPVGLLYALGAAISWAAGTVYLKRARIHADPLAIAAWQLAIGAAVAGGGLVVFEGLPHLWPLPGSVVFAFGYYVVLGTALAYFLWFEIIARLPAATATLGTLLVPVVGVLSAVLLLGERPTATDMAGFTLIFVAAASVLLQPAGVRLPVRASDNE